MVQQRGDYNAFLDRLATYLREPSEDGVDIILEADIKKQLRSYDQDPFFSALLDKRLSEVIDEFKKEPQQSDRRIKFRRLLSSLLSS
jgi:hypothetical protein